MKSLFIVLAIVVGISLIGFTSYVSNYNYGNKIEQEIKAQHKNMENVLSQYSLKIGEAVQVPTMLKNDLKEVLEATMQGRYGKNGSGAVFQWIKEQNIGLDNDLYRKIQQMIEAGRDKFENSQTKLIDTKRAYETSLGSFWSGMWLGIAGYPKIDLDKYNIVTSEYSNEAFETGVEKGLKLR